MATYRLHCEDPWFSKLKDGKKTIEGRLYEVEVKNVKENDEIEFYLDNDQFQVKVIRVEHYKSIREYLEEVGLDNALPGLNSLEEGIKIYRKWYSQAAEKKRGVLGIWVKRV